MELSCQKHPKYKGKRKPKRECEVCLGIYFTFNPGRIPLPRPQPPIRDKTKYSRKKKHKDDGDN